MISNLSVLFLLFGSALACDEMLQGASPGVGTFRVEGLGPGEKFGVTLETNGEGRHHVKIVERDSPAAKAGMVASTKLEMTQLGPFDQLHRFSNSMLFSAWDLLRKAGPFDLTMEPMRTGSA